MVATLGLVLAEVFGGILGRSVALLNDAVHNLSDIPALGISYLAMRWAERPADTEKTYGYHRAGTLAAYTNAFVLVLLSLWLGYEAFERLRSPVEVVESWMIWTSVAALAVNGGITLALVRGREYALVEDIQTLTRDALRHRLVLTYQALAEEVAPDVILDQVITAVPVPQIDLARRSVA